jgi:hypothetical protein
VQLREAILGALEAAGGPEGSVGYLTRLAENNSSAFASLLGKCLPHALAADESGGNVKIQFTREIVYPSGRREVENMQHDPARLPDDDVEAQKNTRPWKPVAFRKILWVPSTHPHAFELEPVIAANIGLVDECLRLHFCLQKKLTVGGFCLQKKLTVGGCNGKASDVSTWPGMIRTGDLALMSQSPQHPSPAKPAPARN